MQEAARRLADAASALARNPDDPALVKRVDVLYNRLKTAGSKGYLIDVESNFSNTQSELNRLNGAPVNLIEVKNADDIPDGSVVYVTARGQRIQVLFEKQMNYRKALDQLFRKNATIVILFIHLQNNLPTNYENEWRGMQIINLVSKPSFGSGARPLNFMPTDNEKIVEFNQTQWERVNNVKVDCSVCNQRKAKYIAQPYNRKVCSRSCSLKLVT